MMKAWAYGRGEIKYKLKVGVLSCHYRDGGFEFRHDNKQITEDVAQAMLIWNEME